MCLHACILEPKSIDQLSVSGDTEAETKAIETARSSDPPSTTSSTPPNPKASPASNKKRKPPSKRVADEDE
jgi:hypothetical protein